MDVPIPEKERQNWDRVTKLGLLHVFMSLGLDEEASTNCKEKIVSILLHISQPVPQHQQQLLLFWLPRALP